MTKPIFVVLWSNSKPKKETTDHRQSRCYCFPKKNLHGHWPRFRFEILIEKSQRWFVFSSGYLEMDPGTKYPSTRTIFSGLFTTRADPIVKVLLKKSNFEWLLLQLVEERSEPKNTELQTVCGRTRLILNTKRRDSCLGSQKNFNFTSEKSQY